MFFSGLINGQKLVSKNRNPGCLVNKEKKHFYYGIIKAMQKIPKNILQINEKRNILSNINKSKNHV